MPAVAPRGEDLAAGAAAERHLRGDGARRDAAAASAAVGPSFSGFCSVIAARTPRMRAPSSSRRQFHTIRAASGIAGSSRSCTSITNSAVSPARISSGLRGSGAVGGDRWRLSVMPSRISPRRRVAHWLWPTRVRNNGHGSTVLSAVATSSQRRMSADMPHGRAVGHGTHAPHASTSPHENPLHHDSHRSQGRPRRHRRRRPGDARPDRRQKRRGEDPQADGRPGARRASPAPRPTPSP